MTYLQSSDSRDTKNLNRTKRPKDTLKRGTPRIASMIEGRPEFYQDGANVVSYVKFGSIVYSSKFSPINSAGDSKFPLPDYESEWVGVGNNESVDFVHNLSLNSIPNLIQILLSNVKEPTIGTDVILASFQTNENNGAHVEFKDADKITVHGGDSKLYANAGFGSSPPSDFTDGFIKIKLWI